MIRTIGAALLAATLAGSALAAPAASPEQEIRRVLEDSAQAWSRGDLDGFMRSYEDGAETAFVTRKGLLKSRRAIRDRYAARYNAAPGPKAAEQMGRLRLDLLGVRLFSPEWAMATGRYTLARRGKPDTTGLTSLLFHHSAAGWRIVYDHSS